MCDEALTDAERRYFESRGEDTSGLNYTPPPPRPRDPPHKPMSFRAGRWRYQETPHHPFVYTGREFNLYWWRVTINGVTQYYGHASLGWRRDPKTGKLEILRSFLWRPTPSDAE